jgi:hypothetical protein
MFLFVTVSRQALEPTISPVKWVLGAISLDAKQAGHAANHFSPSSTGG